MYLLQQKWPTNVSESFLGAADAAYAEEDYTVFNRNVHTKVFSQCEHFFSIITIIMLDCNYGIYIGFPSCTVVALDVSTTRTNLNINMHNKKVICMHVPVLENH